MPTCQEERLQYLEAKPPQPRNTTGGGVWEARAFVFAQRALEAAGTAAWKLGIL